MIPNTKENCLKAAARMAGFAKAAAGNGRADDAALLDLAAHCCKECAEYAPEQAAAGPQSSGLGPQSSEAPAVCCLCDGIGVPRNGGWTCPNRRCPRYGVPLPRDTFTGHFEDAQETRQDRAGEAGDSGAADTRLKDA